MDAGEREGASEESGVGLSLIAGSLRLDFRTCCVLCCVPCCVLWLVCLTMSASDALLEEDAGGEATAAEAVLKTGLVGTTEGVVVVSVFDCGTCRAAGTSAEELEEGEEPVDAAARENDVLPLGGVLPVSIAPELTKREEVEAAGAAACSSKP